MRGWLPKSVLSLREYSLSRFVRDLVAGLTVGFVALPLAMAFAISSGVPPQSGIYCAIVAGFLCSALGGSNTQISGPTGAFVVVVSGIVLEHGIEGLFVCTFLAGVILVLLGATGLGSAVKYLPRPVVVGFTNGIAVLIASTQIKDFLGLKVEKVPGEFLGRMEALVGAAGTLSGVATLLAFGSLAVILLMRKFLPKVPGAIAVLFGATALAFLLGLPVETIESRFGGIPQGLPKVHVPPLSLLTPRSISQLIAPAITIAILGAIESLMSAVVADRMTRDRHNPNVELVAQGVSNLASPLFGGLPATGAIARTATNIRSGAQTPVAGMIHALTLLAILLVAAPLAGHVPLAALAAILMMVAYNMGEWHEIPEILRLSKADVAVWAVTFGLTVFADLTVAVQAGMILAALVFIRKVTNTTTVALVDDAYLEDARDHALHLHQIPAGVAVFRINGPFMFGTTDKVAHIMDDIESLPPVVVVRLRNMTAIDATGVQALEELFDRLTEMGKQVLFCGLRSQPEELLRRSGFFRHVGEDNVCENVKQAMGRTRRILKEHQPALGL
ncbi:MAG TPA: SulP family inorganic anion transporter [Fimbriimonas sp.]